MPLQVERLLKGNDTLFGVPPSIIAHSIGDKLNSIENHDRRAVQVFPLPDSHIYGSDGGVKDIFFVTQERPSHTSRRNWSTALLSDSDETTYWGFKTPGIERLLEEAVAKLVTRGFTIGHIVPIADHHNSAFGQGVGGFDGLKNLVFCYHRTPTPYPRS